MRLDFSIGIASPQQRRTPCSPASLFTPGAVGFHFDPAQMSSLYQDAAATIPVTAAGQPVGCMKDLSGLGNHATQGTAGSRPTYQTASGKHWLEFDGVDDFMLTPVVALGSTRATIGVALRKAADVRATIIDGADAPRLTLEAPGFSGGDFAAFLWTTISVNGSVRRVAAAPATAVLVADFDMVTRTVRMAMNGGAPASAVAASGSGAFTDGAYSIGRRSSATQYLNGRLFGLVAVNRLLTIDESSQLTAYLNSRSDAF